MEYGVEHTQSGTHRVGYKWSWIHTECGMEYTYTWIGILTRSSSGVCELWSVAKPSQNKKRKARPVKTEGGKRCVIARG